MFAELFRKKMSDWELNDEVDLLPLDRGWWVPDFRLTHRASGKQVFLEVLGFWRRGAVETHLRRLRQFAGAPFILAVSEQLKIDDEELEGLSAEIHRFRSMPQPDEVVRLAGELISGKNLFD
jgi:predicted nuclease of restriction endonuclease-like RecB superfamily